MATTTTYTAAEKAALAWLSERSGGATSMCFVPDEHLKAFGSLARRSGRDKPLSEGRGVGGMVAYTLRPAGLAVVKIEAAADRVHYERSGNLAKASCEATIEAGAFGFAGHGSTFEEARTELLHRLEVHRRQVESAIEEVRVSRPPADPEPE